MGLAADAVLALHLLFILFVAVGGALGVAVVVINVPFYTVAWRRRRPRSSPR